MAKDATLGSEGKWVPCGHGDQKSAPASATLAHLGLGVYTLTVSCAESSTLGNISIQVCCGYMYHARLIFFSVMFFLY
jgi:hypothetical protein